MDVNALFPILVPFFYTDTMSGKKKLVYNIALLP